MYDFNWVVWSHKQVLMKIEAFFKKDTWFYQWWVLNECVISACNNCTIYLTDIKNCLFIRKKTKQWSKWRFRFLWWPVILRPLLSNCRWWFYVFVKNINFCFCVIISAAYFSSERFAFEWVAECGFSSSYLIRKIRKLKTQTRIWRKMVQVWPKRKKWWEILQG